MPIANLRSKISRQFRRFARTERGNVAITFAFAALPILTFVGAAVDYSRAHSVKAALQTALDATALMLAKEAASVTADQLQTDAQKYFTAIFDRPEATNVTISATYTTTGGSTVVVNGTLSVPTTIMQVAGFDKIDVNGSSTTKWGMSRLRVALVLDNTGSMAQAGKMTALKSATKSLLDQLQGAASANGDVYVSIIPFSKDVNVGAHNYNADWIDWEDWDAANGQSQSAGSCSSRSRRGSSRCSGNSSTWVPKSHTTWNGCITDRDRDYDQLVTAPNPADATLPAGQASTLFPADQDGGCPLEMMGLSYNWAAMRSLVDQMYPNGFTNQPIGLVWGWQSLVGGGPLSAPAKDPNYQYKEVIILLSDGLNTRDRWYQSQTPIDNRMYQTGNGSGTCANIKASGITIYTIQVNTGGDPTSTLLQNCATSRDKFWMITSANQIVQVFNSIGTDLAQLRVAQ